MNKSLESEVGIEPTFADLQSAAKPTIDNSFLAQSGGVEPPSSDLESEALATKTKTVLKWHSQRDSNPQIFWFVARYSIQVELWEH